MCLCSRSKCWEKTWIVLFWAIHLPLGSKSSNFSQKNGVYVYMWYECVWICMCVCCVHMCVFMDASRCGICVGESMYVTLYLAPVSLIHWVSLCLQVWGSSLYFMYLIGVPLTRDLPLSFSDYHLQNPKFGMKERSKSWCCRRTSGSIKFPA